MAVLTDEQKAERAERLVKGRAKLREKQAAKRAEQEALKAPKPISLPGGDYRMWSDGRIEAYGCFWPRGKTIAEIESALYAHDHIRDATPGALPRHEHFIKFIKLMVPEAVFGWHRWVYECVELWCEDYWTCIGAAGTGKSAVFGLCVLCDWLADPANTVSVLVSTSLDSLKGRIWKYVCQWYEAVDPVYRTGSFRQANPLGLLHVAAPTAENEQPQWKGAGILCVGFKAGDSSESIKNHLGRHLLRNRIVVDEQQGVNRAVLDLWWNMGASGEFRQGGFGNPMSMFDALADAAAPSGHSSRLAAFDWLHREMMDVGSRRKKTWETERGRCLMLDGRESPALDDPKKFHYLIGKEHIEKARKAGENSLQWYAFIVGIFPPTGGANTLLSAKEITETGSDKTGVVWDGAWYDWLWGDLAHGGEDAAEIQRVRVGPTVGGVTMIEMLEPYVLTIDEKRGLISRQMARQVEEIARRHGIPATRIAIDATATQGAMIDAIEEEMKQQGIVRIHAAGPPSKLAVKSGWPQMCKEAYENRAAELAGNFREFVRAGQVRGIDGVLAQQACSRVTMPQEECGGKLKLHEDKRAGNGGKSPNRLDLACVGFTALRERASIHPGEGRPAPEFAQNDGYEAWRKRAKALDGRSRGGRIGALMRKY